MVGGGGGGREGVCVCGGGGGEGGGDRIWSRKQHSKQCCKTTSANLNLNTHTYSHIHENEDTSHTHIYTHGRRRHQHIHTHTHTHTQSKGRQHTLRKATPSAGECSTFMPTCPSWETTTCTRTVMRWGLGPSPLSRVTAKFTVKNAVCESPRRQHTATLTVHLASLARVELPQRRDSGVHDSNTALQLHSGPNCVEISVIIQVVRGRFGRSGGIFKRWVA